MRGAIAAIVLMTSVAASAQEQPPVQAAQRTAERARTLYNEGKPAEALALIKPLIARPGHPGPYAIVAARALLEQFRITGDQADLAAARDHLRAVDPGSLTPQDRRDLTIGLAEALYLDDAFSSAAELFETSLAPAGEGGLTGEARERVLDWWATALDRHAQVRPQAERRLVYQRILTLMERETRTEPASTPAAYWLAAAARGMGDLDRAWSASVAAWVRAPMMRDRGAALRADIDRLAAQALIPERARALGLGPKETEQAIAGMQAEWDLLKSRWTR